MRFVMRLRQLFFLFCAINKSWYCERFILLSLLIVLPTCYTQAKLFITPTEIHAVLLQRTVSYCSKLRHLAYIN